MITISIPDFPEGEEMTVDEYHAWLSENATFEIDGDGLTGKIGGTRPTEDEGIFVNGLDIELWDAENSQYRVVSSIPVGGLIMWASASAVIPAHYLLCDGRTVSRETYAKLFSAIGTTHNRGGEDSASFRLPDFRGRAPMGAGSGEYRDGITGSLQLRTMGEYPGASWPRNIGSWGNAPTSANRYRGVGSGDYPALKPISGSLIGDNTPPSVVVQFLIRHE